MCSKNSKINFPIKFHTNLAAFNEASNEQKCRKLMQMGWKIQENELYYNYAMLVSTTIIKSVSRTVIHSKPQNRNCRQSQESKHPVPTLVFPFNNTPHYRLQHYQFEFYPQFCSKWLFLVHSIEISDFFVAFMPGIRNYCYHFSK